MSTRLRAKALGAVALAAATVVAGVAPAASASSHKSAGSLVMIGGNLDEDSAILQRIVDLAKKGKGAYYRPTIALVTAAARPARTPEQAADSSLNNAAANGLYYGDLFDRFGADTYAVPIDTAVNYDGDPYVPENAFSPEVAARIAEADGVFFGGGDQMRYVRTLLECEDAADEAFTSCQDTPALAAVRSVLNKGGVVAGVSAGTTIQQGKNMVTGGEPYEGWRDGAKPGYFDDPAELAYLPYGGFGFFDAGLVDSHFGTWSRQARMIRLALHTGDKLIFGPDETTALVVDRKSRRAEVIGRNGVSVIDVSKARGQAPDEVKGVRWTYLVPGDRIDLKSGHVTPAGTPLSGSGEGPAPVADVWDSVNNDPVGSYSLVDLGVALVKSGAKEAAGTTFETDPQFRTTLVKKGGTKAWTSDAGTGFRNLVVRIAPVQ